MSKDRPIGFAMILSPVLFDVMELFAKMAVFWEASRET